MKKKVVLDYKRELVKEDVPPMTREHAEAIVNSRKDEKKTTINTGPVDIEFYHKKQTD